ncbi:MAG: flavohemoglobin expression-modulating QEGLA motif protein, partial [Gammaproteobacteria bacterium]|nr:flavohemoglobin expression-modulating QEGLA motif protein [Gammaproteobacteria bacterium]
MDTPMTVDRDVAHHTALDAQLVEAVGGIKLLGLTSWPAALQAPFLASVARGQPVLPQVDYPKLDFTDTRHRLAAISAQC